MSANKRKGSEVFAGRFKELLAETDKAVLCQKLDLTGETAFRQWSNGFTMPTADKLIIIAEHFSVSIDWLLGVSDTRTSDIGTRAACWKFGLSELALNRLEMLHNSTAQPMGELVIDGIEKMLMSPRGEEFFRNFALLADIVSARDEQEISFNMNSSRYDTTEVFLPEKVVVSSVFHSQLIQEIGEMINFYSGIGEKREAQGGVDDGTV